MGDGETEKRILTCLEKAAPQDLHINEIATRTKLNRMTVSRYLYALQSRGEITLTRSIGTLKFFTIKKETETKQK